MKCKKCKVSVMEKPLQRVNKIGVVGIWWCWDCILKHKPVLYKKLKKNQSEVEKLLAEWSYGKKNK